MYSDTNGDSDKYMTLHSDVYADAFVQRHKNNDAYNNRHGDANSGVCYKHHDLDIKHDSFVDIYRDGNRNTDIYRNVNIYRNADIYMYTDAYVYTFTYGHTEFHSIADKQRFPDNNNYNNRNAADHNRYPHNYAYINIYRDFYIDGYIYTHGNRLGHAGADNNNFGYADFNRNHIADYYDSVIYTDIGRHGNSHTHGGANSGRNNYIDSYAGCVADTFSNACADGNNRRREHCLSQPVQTGSGRPVCRF